MTLRPLRLGELIDRSIALWRAHWRALFILTLPFQVVEFIFIKLGLWVGRQQFPAMSDPAALQAVLKASPGEALRDLGAMGGVLILAWVSSYAVSLVAGVAQTRLLYPLAVGAPAPSTTVASRAALRQTPAVLGSLALMSGWTALVGALFLAPAAIGFVVAFLVRDGSPRASVAVAVLGGLVLAAGLLGLLVWFILRFLLQAQVLAVETGGALNAFRRSATLSSGTVEPGVLGWVKVRLTILVTVVGVMLMVVGLLNSIPTLLAGVVWGATLQPGHTIDDVVPQLVLVPIQVVQVFVGSLFAPIFETFKVLFYVDMRVRREGLDLELGLAAPRAPTENP